MEKIIPSSTQSLLNYLRSRDPHLDATPCRPGKNTASKNNPWDLPQRIEVWKDFEYDALQSIYGGVLRQVLERQFALETFAIPEFPFCHIHDEDSLESLLVKWNQSVMSNALSTAQGCLEGRLIDGEIYMCEGGQAQWPSESFKRRRPDWAGVKPAMLLEEAQSKAKNLLPGDTKLSKKWSSAAINQGNLEEAENRVDWLQPMGQIFTYCVGNNARYGYLITDKELVVVRVRPNEETDEAETDEVDSQGPVGYMASVTGMSSEEAKAALKAVASEGAPLASRTRRGGLLEYRAIPWRDHIDETNEDTGLLTVNLALWWLHMMAANESAIEENYPPLRDTKWNEDADTEASSFVVSDTSQNRGSLDEMPPYRQLETLSLEPRRGVKKRPRKEKSPRKRKTRGRD